ncbi:MAG: type VI secretion system contractile sheath small subunit [Pseudomonadota bacterium]
MKSVYDKIEKVRKPRVQISYKLEENGASVTKEIPFVMGVMGDYSGHSEAGKMPLKDKKFIEIDGENFNQVMKKMSPELSVKVDNKLTDDDNQLAVDLKFNRMEDFEPDKIAEQVPALKNLLDTRAKLREMLSKADRSDELEAILENVLQNHDELKQLSEQLNDTNEEKPNVE